MLAAVDGVLIAGVCRHLSVIGDQQEHVEHGQHLDAHAIRTRHHNPRDVTDCSES